MDDIDELIERLKGFAIECAEINQKCAELADDEKLNVLAEDTDWWKAATALQEMQQRIAELEKGYQLQKSNAGGAYEQIKRLDAALDTCSQMILEVAHAQRNGSDWYTKGESGLYRQVSMWIRKASDAINDARAGR